MYCVPKNQHEETAHYGATYDGESHKKWIHIDSSKTGKPTVTFEAYSDWPGTERRDIKKLEWGRFVNLMEAVEREHGESFVRDVFVGDTAGPTEVSNRREIDGTTTVGVMESTRSENGSYLHFYYDGDHAPGSERLCLRWVQEQNGGPPENKGSPAGDIYSWKVQDHELRGLLEQTPKLPQEASSTGGFDPSLREALFFDRDPDRVRRQL